MGRCRGVTAASNIARAQEVMDGVNAGLDAQNKERSAEGERGHTFGSSGGQCAEGGGTERQRDRNGEPYAVRGGRRGGLRDLFAGHRLRQSRDPRRRTPARAVAERSRWSDQEKTGSDRQ